MDNTDVELYFINRYLSLLKHPTRTPLDSVLCLCSGSFSLALVLLLGPRTQSIQVLADGFKEKKVRS